MTFYDLSIFEIAGIIGFLSYLGGFAALQLGVLNGNGRLYTLSNLFGASFVLVSMADAFNLGSALISVSWIVIGVYGLTRQTFFRSGA